MSAPARLLLKPGVSLKGLNPPMSIATQVICGVYGNHGFAICTLTSVADGKHSRGSKHYIGNACDYRTVKMDKTYDWESVRDDIANALGDEFDVVLERTHLHVEFDPKV